MLRAAVPVAAIYEDSHFRRPEDQIGRSAKVRHGAGSDAVAQTLGMDESPDKLLWLSVTAADRLHVAAPGGRRCPGTLWSYPRKIFGHTHEGSPGASSKSLRLP